MFPPGYEQGRVAGAVSLYILGMCLSAFLPREFLVHPFICGDLDLFMGRRCVPHYWDNGHTDVILTAIDCGAIAGDPDKAQLYATHTLDYLSLALGPGATDKSESVDA